MTGSLLMPLSLTSLTGQSSWYKSILNWSVLMMSPIMIMWWSFVMMSTYTRVALAGVTSICAPGARPAGWYAPFPWESFALVARSLFLIHLYPGWGGGWGADPGHGVCALLPALGSKHSLLLKKSSRLSYKEIVWHVIMETTRWCLLLLGGSRATWKMMMRWILTILISLTSLILTEKPQLICLWFVF